MKNRYIIPVVLLLFTAICNTGCSKWLSVDPVDRQTEKQIFTTKGGCYSVLNGIYMKMYGNNLYGQNLSYGFLDVIGMRYNIKEKNEMLYSAVQFKYEDEKVRNAISNIWKDMYATILTCNVTLKNLEDKKELFTKEEYGTIKGELLGVRAFLHFDLLRLFGPIYSTNKTNLSIPYNTASEILVKDLLPAETLINDYLMKDILEAEKLLEANDPVIELGPQIEAVEGEPNFMKYRQIRFNYYALMTFKARVELYKGDKTAAFTTATKIISQQEQIANFPFVDPNHILGSITMPDYMFSTEVFFGFYDKKRGLIFKNYFDTGNSANNNILQPRSKFVETNLFQGLTATDYRYKSLWTLLGSAGNVAPTLCKYKEIFVNPDIDAPFHATFVSLIRKAELYLIAAETAPDYTQGLSYLNILRKQRGNSELTDISGEAALNQQILSEYSREFYSEGQMFFYYKRRNIDIPSTNNGYKTSAVSFKDNAAYAVIPIPSEGEINIR